MKKLKWYFEQLFPRTNYSKYFNGQKQIYEFCIWRQWLGRCWDITRFELYDGIARIGGN